MESVVEEQLHDTTFVPITPSKTLNCALNSAIQYDSGFDECISTEFRPLDVNLISPALTVGSGTRLFWEGAPSWLRGNAVSEESGSGSKVVDVSDKATQFAPDTKKDDDEVNENHQKNKKQKFGSALNKKPGEKRQNKYYWAKIDAPKPHTPTPKTPKVATPKPPKPKTPKPSHPKTPKVSTPKPRRNNDKKKPIQCSKIPEHVQGKPVINVTCKRSLNFKSNMTTDLGTWNIPKKIVENVFEKSAKDTPCTRVLNLGDGDMAFTEAKPDMKIKKKIMIVYHRRCKSKCLYKCRNLVPKFEDSFKKMRRRRNKMSFGALKKFEGFNQTCLVENLLDRILRVKGKLSMLLPTKVDHSEDLFKCVLTLLSSRATFMKKKRLPRARRSSKQLVDLDESTPSAAHPSPPTIELLKDKSHGENISTELKSFNSDVDLSRQCHVYAEQTQRGSDTLAVIPIPSTSKGSALVCQGSKNKLIKEKNSKLTYKKRGKQEDYLSTLSDWHDASVEKIMEKFALKFGSLKLNDDPKTWIIQVSDQDNKTDGLFEKIKLEEEKTNLYKKIGSFLQEMYYYQGSKKFIKWNGSVLDSVVGVFLTQNVCDILSSNAYMNMASKYPIKPPTNSDSDVVQMVAETTSSQGSSEAVSGYQKVIVEHPDDKEETTPNLNGDETTPNRSNDDEEYNAALKEMLALFSDLEEARKKGKQAAEDVVKIDWEKIRVRFSKKTRRVPENEDSVDWEAVRKADVLVISDIIRHRGQHRIIAAKILKTLNRLVKDHGGLDLEWLRDAPPQVAKAYLLSFYGLGLKSVECLRLLTLHHHGFPVDVNISRIAIRLGWVPIKPLPPGMPFHLLQKYPLEDEIQKYLWQRLCHLKQETLYHLHYQMITFGKVFCQKRSPNCRACPFKSDCKYYASLSESQRLALPGPADRKTKKSKKHEKVPNPFDRITRRPSDTLPCLTSNISSCLEICVSSSNAGPSSQLSTTFNVSQIPEYFVELPSSPKPEVEEVEEEQQDRVRNAKEVDLVDIEDCCDGYMYHLELNIEENKRALLNYCPESDISSQNSASREIVNISPNDAFNPLPKQVNVSRLRTEHQVYELPRDNQLLNHLNLERQLGDIPYLLAIWTSGQKEKTCDITEECSYSSEAGCTSREDSSTIPGTLLIPVQTAMRKSFPLNGTYFQMNEVFVDYETSKHPVNVPTKWIWNLKKRTLYCGSSTSSIVKGTTEKEIRQCFREGFVCTRGFNRQTREPEALPKRFHSRVKGKSHGENEDVGLDL